MKKPEFSSPEHALNKMYGGWLGTVPNTLCYAFVGSFLKKNQTSLENQNKDVAKVIFYKAQDGRYVHAAVVVQGKHYEVDIKGNINSEEDNARYYRGAEIVEMSSQDAISYLRNREYIEKMSKA